VAGPPFGGAVLLADTSAWTRASTPGLGEEFSSAVVGGQIVTCAATMIEILYTARSATEFDELEEMLRSLRDIAITRSVTQAAIAAMRELAHRAPLHHRVSVADALVAAAAADAGIGVLHFDRHFDRLATVLPFESRWIVQPT
jgi:predicted nucleic acid-binding protein